MNDGKETVIFLNSIYIPKFTTILWWGIAICSVEGCQGVWRRVSFQCQEAHSFSMCFLGNCYFCIYLFHFVFILFLFSFFYVIVFFYFLFNSHIVQPSSNQHLTHCLVKSWPFLLECLIFNGTCIVNPSADAASWPSTEAPG